MKLDPEKILALLKPEGPIARVFPGFEPRLEQSKMLEDVIDAYNQNRIALIEAGTGCGKSLAYLVPALLNASLNQERTVISTNTINLQEQLLNKDIPLLLNALKLNLKVTLVKGMGNYLCLRKLDDAKIEKGLFSSKEQEEIEQIDLLAPSLKEGSRSELPFAPSGQVWEKVNAEHDTCTYEKCPHFKQCRFFQARNEAMDSQVLIVNHHLLFADISMRAEADNYEQNGLLPSYSRLILDEAHNIEEIATEYFSKKVSRLALLKTLSRLSTEKSQGQSHGKIPMLKEKLNQFLRSHDREMHNLISRLSIDLSGMKRDVLLNLGDAFDTVGLFLEKNASDEKKLRLKSGVNHTVEWYEGISPKIQLLIKSLSLLESSLNSIIQDVVALNNERLTEQTKSIRHDIHAMGHRLSHHTQVLKQIIDKEIPSNNVRWVEETETKMLSNIHLVDAELDLSKRMAEFLFSKFQTVVLLSATLTTQNSFHFLRERIGLKEEWLKRPIVERIYPSPFNYRKQTLLAMVSDLPLPNHPHFIDAASGSIANAIEASRGGAFVLFTSYAMMNKAFQIVEKQLKGKGYLLLKQGTLSRQAMIHEFKKTRRAVLFGTDSFWEGVDVAGDALRCVIITKLPFKVPSEPIIEARIEDIIAKGKNPFSEFSLPQAIVKFKQGFGRLIRQKNDSGTVICLDTRMISKNYGKHFLESLPACEEVRIETAKLKETLEAFYRKIYFRKMSSQCQ